MSGRNTLTSIAEEIGLILQPLGSVLQSPEGFTVFMMELGWYFEEIPQPLSNLTSPIETALNLIKDGEVDPSKIDDLLGAIGSFLNALENIKNQPNNLFPDTIDADEFKSEFPGQLIQFLAVEYFLNKQMFWGNLMKVLGLIRIEPVDAKGKRLDYLKKEVAWNELGQILDDPLVTFRNTYQWGTSEFKAFLLFENVAGLAETLKTIAPRLRTLDDQTFAHFTKEAIQIDSVQEWALYFPFIEMEFEEDFAEFNLEAGFMIYMLPETPNEKPGFSILPYAQGDLEEEIPLFEDIFLRLEGNYDWAGGLAIVVRPDQPINVLMDIIPSAEANVAPPSGGNFSISIINRGSEESKIIILGSEEGSRFEVGTISLKGGVLIDSTSTKDFFIEYEMNEAKILIKPSPGEADSFLNSILPKEGFAIDFSLLIGLSTSQGFYFGGSGGLEINLPVHIQVGPVEIISSVITIKAESGKIPVELGASLKVNLGALKASVENIGLRAEFSFPSDNSGRLGPLDVDLGFKPPTGLGLAVDGGGFKGGGFLSFDPDNERYTGVLQLEFNKIALTAIGLLTTGPPGKQKEFSLLIIITSEFEAIQLGYGFTLNKAGGLLGLNRKTKVEPLREGIKSNTLSGILFPTDPVANANRIISDLRQIFPPQEKRFTFGPMAKIDWGTPTPLITIELGLVIEVPSPVRIALLGVLKALLPDKDKALLRLQVNFLGVLEFEKKLLAFDASIYDSRLLSITLFGDMALRLSWGANPNFLLSVGGFHPAYDPPKELADMKRLTVALSTSSSLRLTLETYFAVTSNTVQFGARMELKAGGTFNVYGFMGMDTLFYFDPFHFTAQISAGFALRKGTRTFAGVQLSFTLSGPTPWNAKGKASLKILFFKITVKFNKTFGERRDTSLPDKDIWIPLQKALSNKSNWEAAIPRSLNPVVSLKKVPDADKDILIHPIGSIRVSQKIVPLNLQLDKFGNTKPAGEKFFDITKVTLDGNEMQVTEAREQFAPAQYREFSNSEKLSLDAFQRLKSGVVIHGSEELASSYAIPLDVRYEKIILDENGESRKLGIFNDDLLRFKTFLKGNAIAKSPYSYARKLDGIPTHKIDIDQESYTVVSNIDIKPYDGNSRAKSQVEAMAYMERLIETNPELEGFLQVVPNYEVNSI